MKPYTREDAEAELDAALAAGDLDTAWSVAAELDRMPVKPAPSLLAAALWYAAHDLPVFPLQPMSKKPWGGTRGVKDATTEPEALRQWWCSGRGYAESNVGLATGHRVDVIDFDGPQAHADWTRVMGEDWDDAGVRVLGSVYTPRAGGLHVYVPATGTGNRAGMAGPHVDYRGVGGYVVAPPSRTELGSYRWLRPLDLGEGS